MPSAPTHVFAEALAEILGRLENAKALRLIEAYALIGGFAVSAWGIPRATRDLDFAVALETVEPLRLSEALKGTYQAGGADDPLRGVFHILIPTADPPIPVQLVVLPVSWTAIVFKHLEPVSILGSTVPVVSWQALLLLKLYAGGPSDLLDARDMWRVCAPTPQAIQNLRELAAQVGLTKDFDGFLAHQ